MNERNLYRQIDGEISEFLKHAGQIAKDPSCLPRLQPKVMGEVEKMQRSAGEIGGKLLLDVETLAKDVHIWMEKPKEHKVLEKMMKDALRIKQEVSEL